MQRGVGHFCRYLVLFGHLATRMYAFLRNSRHLGCRMYAFLRYSRHLGCTIYVFLRHSRDRVAQCMQKRGKNCYKMQKMTKKGRLAAEGYPRAKRRGPFLSLFSVVC